uniref:Uncharacterized protein n=1 Tax=Amphiprion percula TaxID=161767 RepID=A0A3P8SDG9_AMPPE
MFPSPPLEVAQELQKKVSVVSQPECSICFNTTTMSSKHPNCWNAPTPSVECLSRLMAVSTTDKDGDDGNARLSCPFCRHPTVFREVLCKLPTHQQHEEPVWLDGEKLCYSSSRQDGGSNAPDSPVPFCICIDIGASKEAAAPVQTQGQTSGLLGRMSDWKRWSSSLCSCACVFSTGNIRCLRDNPLPQPGTLTAITYLAT